MPKSMANIKHIVVVMLENRSLDNVLGWLYSDKGNQPAANIPPSGDGKKPTYDGLVEGRYSLPITTDNGVENYPIIKGTCGNGFAVPSLDPWEEYEHVTNQLFGNQTHYGNPTPESGTEPTMAGFLQDFTTSYLAVDGFSEQIHDYLVKHGGTLGEKVWHALQSLPPGLKDLSIQTWHQSLQITQTFTPEQLPVLNGLARSFAVSDRWFSSVPTQTNPNRAFFHCGTSLGREKNSNIRAEEQFETDTLWNVLDHYNEDPDHECDCTWGIFYHEPFPSNQNKCFTGYTFPHIYNIENAQSHFYEMSEFKRMASAGRGDTLPAFCFLEPKWGWGVNKDYPGDWGKLPYQQGNDYHPPTSVRAGELFLKDIYDTLSLNEELWAQTLLIVTFDEHGGTWDHVPPPWGATPPDCHGGERNKFKFDRFGVRVPTLLISPYIEESTVFRSEESVPYDHTSIIATILEWQGIDRKAPKKAAKPEENSSGAEKTEAECTEEKTCPDPPEKPWLGWRVANAPTFEGVLTLTTARTDRPVIKIPPEESAPPITINNNTPAQIYVYLGWGPDSGPTKHHKLPTRIWGGTPSGSGFPGSVDPGHAAHYVPDVKDGGNLFDYWVQASCYVGPDAGTPPDLVDSVIGLNKNWRLFWKGWRLITHHDSLTISLAKPHAAIRGADTKGRIRIVNNGTCPIKFDIRFDALKAWWKWGTLPPGKSVSFSTNDWRNHKYFLGLKFWKKGFLPGVTETWEDFWPQWKPVGRNATVTITQKPPEISTPCAQ